MAPAYNKFRGHHFTCWRMKVFIGAVKGPQESKAQIHSSNSNSRGKSLTFPHLNLHFRLLWATIPEFLIVSCSEITIPTFMLSSKPSINTNKPLISCVVPLNLVHSCLAKSNKQILSSDWSMHDYNLLPF